MPSDFRDSNDSSESNNDARFNPMRVSNSGKPLPAISQRTPNILNQSEVMAYMPNSDFFLWFTPVATKLALVLAVAPALLCLLDAVGLFKRLIFPLAVAYINALKPFLQLSVSQQFTTLVDGLTNLIYFIFGVLGLAVTFLTIRILRNQNALCFTANGLSLGNSTLIADMAGKGNIDQLGAQIDTGLSQEPGSRSVQAAINRSNKPTDNVRQQVIYQESKELDFRHVTELEIVRPTATKSNLDYQFVFRRGMHRPFRIRYGDILKTNDRASFVAAIKDFFGDMLDDEALEPFEVAGDKQSYTELWLKELSASPKRDKLTPLELGATLYNGRYTIISKIGMGGQGTVYLAQDNLATNTTTRPKESAFREVVLKEFLLPVFPDSRVRKAAALKFQEEADLLGKLEHPQIVKFFELFLEDHRAYLVLEKLEGITLKNYVESTGPLPLHFIADLAWQMCQILKYLHDQTPPVVHRDFTPDNLILSDDGSLKLLDFSVAQSVTSNVTGSVVGKPHYISPEQFRGKSSSQSDIYSMGATLFFLATGKQPEPITNQRLSAEDINNHKTKSEIAESIDEVKRSSFKLAETIQQKFSRPELNQKELNQKKLISKLSNIIEKSTKLDLAKRYKNVDEILQDLD